MKTNKEPTVYQDGIVCDLLFQQIPKPKNLITCKAINVYDNKYRINVYTTYVVDSETGLEGQRIGYSCFARLDNKTLQILYPPVPSGNVL